MSLIRSIQADAIEASTSVSSLLRKCKLLASRVGHPQLEQWVDLELRGYPEGADLPAYRVTPVVSYGSFVGAFGVKKREPEQTLFELRMASLLPADTVTQLETTHGAKFAQLSALEKLIIVTASVEGYIDHKRIREITDQHPADITKTLSKLSREGLLSATGHGRGTIYFDAYQTATLMAEVEGDVFSPAPLSPPLSRMPATLGTEGGQSPKPPVHSEGLTFSSGGLEASSGGLGLPQIQEPPGRARNVILSLYPQGLPRKMKQEVLRDLILDLCAVEALSLRDLATLLDRAPDFIRIQYIRPMVAAGSLVAEFPDRPRHPAQRYRRA
ncbi:hypothetical protein ACEN2Y_00730 (plasmid) [Ralstonia solanacearum]|uniref:AbiTii domain-containing protein n=1 Tax=Ralstonia solanacearum TaxID=305 RepID=UPI0032177A37